MTKSATSTAAASVRLDKWLWAARFFKTRALAKQAIEGGKVRYNGQRSKVSKDVEIGAKLSVAQGWDDVEVEVVALSDQRGPAAQARLLYAETTASIARRERAAAERKAQSATGMPASSERPSKKQRRMIHRFINESLNNNQNS